MISQSQTDEVIRMTRDHAVALLADGLSPQTVNYLIVRTVAHLARGGFLNLWEEETIAELVLHAVDSAVGEGVNHG